VVSLQINDFDAVPVPQIFLNFSLGGREYFFAANPIAPPLEEFLDIEMPTAIYRAERRDLYREYAMRNVGAPETIQLLRPNSPSILGRVVDRSLHGVGVDVPEEDARTLPENLQVRFDRDASGARCFFAQVRHKEASSRAKGWMRLGLAISHLEPRVLIQVDSRERILNRSLVDEIRSRHKASTEPLREQYASLLQNRPGRETQSVSIVEYKNEAGQRIKAIIDSWGDPGRATAVVIPPSWGRTKETLLPLAATIIQTFRRADRPITVIRFDGTNRRGESHIDPDCRLSGDEYLHFTFSQAARDIEATIDFLHADPQRRPRGTILVTFSLASIEGRRAIARNTKRRFDGWISVVGMADLQSALRTISGGMDYAYGLMRGVSFGLQELVGVIADMDRTGADAIENGMVFLEDARLDMAAIDVPITWIHGRHDAWMSIERIREIMSCGETRNRKIIEVPTGHQLRESREALQTFQLIAEEISKMATGRSLNGTLPSLSLLEERANAERQRIPATSVDVRSFWRDYLLGRDRVLGMELLTATSAYREFMARQISNLSLSSGSQVADLGCGTGGFCAQLPEVGNDLDNIDIYAIDYIVETLERVRDRASEVPRPVGNRVSTILADLDSDEFHHIPLKTESCDAVLASLLLTYLARPNRFLREVFRILKPGGTLVLSGLKKDADISKLFVRGVAELRMEKAREKLGIRDEGRFELLAQNFLNDASKLLEFEERGRFRFWDTAALQDLVAKAGFSAVSGEFSFGDPPQAILVTAQKP
jgi:ubiquinone/menaquinone biosynthesis C-methylase UbiE/pimeloyl-ACP methyl ester carboxylesterase